MRGATCQVLNENVTEVHNREPTKLLISTKTSSVGFFFPLVDLS